MSTQRIVERILSDAHAEAQAILEEAKAKAAKIVADASLRAEKARLETEAEVQEKRNSIFEKQAANARLDSAKALLGEKRKVIDLIYTQALGRLQDLSEEDCLKLSNALLEAYAEKGDELCFAKKFPYKAEVAALPIVAERALTIAQDDAAVSGGFVLKGEKSDKDLSYSTLLAVDRDAYQAALAAEIFK